MSQHLRSTLIAIAETEQQEFSLKQQLRRFEQEIADVNELVAPVETVFQNFQVEKTRLINQQQQMENELEEQRVLIEKLEKHVPRIRNEKEFEFISDTSVDFYWATCIFFRKNPVNKIFFDLVQHIEQEWDHYRRVYQITSNLFRNDFAFSIAIHIMNGFQKGKFAKEMPGKMMYTTDRDICLLYTSPSPRDRTRSRMPSSA